jgi:predicted O-methyltransferase YrrM
MNKLIQAPLDGLKRMRRNVWRWAYGLPSIEVDQIADCSDGPLPRIDTMRNLPPTSLAPHDDFTPLAQIVRGLRPANVLELGTAHGNTTANICALGDAHVYTLDALPEQISGSHTTFKDAPLTRERIGCVYRDHGFAHRVTQIFENTLTFNPRKYFPQPRIDLAIIDACHDLEFVVNDFHKVLPTLRPGAVVLLHDTHPSMHKHLVGSYRACMHLRLRGYDIRHIRGSWWGVWSDRWGDKGQLSSLEIAQQRMLKWILGDPGARAAGIADS